MKGIVSDMVAMVGARQVVSSGGEKKGYPPGKRAKGGATTRGKRRQPMKKKLAEKNNANDLLQKSVNKHRTENAELDKAENSIDLAFVCATFHHFEFPLKSMKSIRRALRPGGKVIVVDFERIEGKSSDWILGHVRAGKEVFQAETEESGFELEEEVTGLLEENYILSLSADETVIALAIAIAAEGTLAARMLILPEPKADTRNPTPETWINLTPDFFKEIDRDRFSHCS